METPEIARGSAADNRPPVKCPNCRALDTLEVKHDAWARFSVLGVSADGELALSDECDTQIFDDWHIECHERGTTFDKDELVSYLLRSRRHRNRKAVRPTAPRL
jgi:hypothetical protein